MDICFDNLKFEQECKDQRLLAKRYGKPMAKVIRRRLDDLDAAETLADMRNLPGRCHQLVGDRSEQFSIDVIQPKRLIFLISNIPPPRKKDGGIDWAQVRSIKIIGIEDTHE